MTRSDVIDEAARRLGDESAGFKAKLVGTLNWVLLDLASYGALPGVRRRNTSSFTLTADTRTYSTTSIVGETSPIYPTEIESLRVWSWLEPDAIIPRLNDVEFDAKRLFYGEDHRGRPRGYRFNPNAQTLEVVPPAGADEDETAVEVVYWTSPTLPTSDASTILDIYPEDMETLVHGIIARMSSFKDETDADAQGAWQLYIAGRNNMYGRLHNPRPTMVIPRSVY